MTVFLAEYIQFSSAYIDDVMVYSQTLKRSSPSCGFGVVAIEEVWTDSQVL